VARSVFLFCFALVFSGAAFFNGIKRRDVAFVERKRWPAYAIKKRGHARRTVLVKNVFLIPCVMRGTDVLKTSCHQPDLPA
jgi:hypothetical protein